MNHPPFDNRLDDGEKSDGLVDKHARGNPNDDNSQAHPKLGANRSRGRIIESRPVRGEHLPRVKSTPLTSIVGASGRSFPPREYVRMCTRLSVTVSIAHTMTAFLEVHVGYRGEDKPTATLALGHAVVVIERDTRLQSFLRGTKRRTPNTPL